MSKWGRTADERLGVGVRALIWLVVLLADVLVVVVAVAKLKGM